MNRTKTTRAVSALLYCALLAAVAAVVAFAVVAVGADLTASRQEYAPLSACDDGWTLWIGGEEHEVTLPLEITTTLPSVTLRRRVDPEESHGSTLFFPNGRQGITVTADGKVIYQVNTSSLSSVLMVKNNALFDLPDWHEPYTLEITFSNFGGTCTLPRMQYGSHYAVCLYVLKSEIITITNLVLLIVVALLLAVAVVFFAIKRAYDRRLGCLVLFLLSVSLWTFCDSPVTALIPAPPELFGALCFPSLMLLPVMIVALMRETCGKRYLGLEVLFFLGFVNIAVQLLLALLGVTLLHQTLLLTHGLILITIAVGLPYVAHESREKPGITLRYLAYGLMLMSAVAALSMVFYWIQQPKLYRTFMLCGITTFFISQLYGLIYAYLDNAQTNHMKIAELEIYERISLYDALTGLGNRRAFEERMSALERSITPGENAVLVMLDLNGLKYTNDSFGHAAGDELIVAAANCIRAAYAPAGECFRIGGDEFAVLVPGASVPLTDYSTKLQEEILRANRDSVLTLSIAKGESALLQPNGERRSVANWKQEADVNMYVDKVTCHTKDPHDEDQELRNIIECIVAAVEARDQYTANHSSRVAEFAVMIARHLGMTPRTLLSIREAALLHDIGKIGVPDSILRKPSRLTDEEYAIAKQHAAIGAHIVSRAPSMEETAAMILHHHERFDGTGYPDGLAGEAIPIGARIITVADTIDAMITDRCYRKALTLEQCRREIENNLGVMYDPAIGQIVLENWNEIERLVSLHEKHLPRYHTKI